MLRITVQEKDEAIGLTLEGRLAGLWVTELNQAWLEIVPRLGQKKVSIDLRNVTYADAAGKQVLSKIYAQANAELVTSTPWTQYLAEEIVGSNVDRSDEEA